MMKAKKPTGRASSIPGGLAAAAAVSLAVTLAGSMLLSKLVLDGILPEENIGYGILVMLLLASFLGGITARYRIKHRKMQVCLLSGLVYFCLLLCMTALFFGGQYHGVGVTGLLVLAGSAAAGLIREGKGTGITKRRKLRL